MSGWTEYGIRKLRRMWADPSMTTTAIMNQLNKTAAQMSEMVEKLELGPKPEYRRHERCPICTIGLEHVSGCPRPECDHYQPPCAPPPRTLAGVSEVA